MNELNTYEQMIHQSRYARWRDDLGRRETWNETVTRYCDYMASKFNEIFPYDLIHEAILNRDVMPSMRALMTAGPALDRDNAAGYNCCYLPINSTRSFDEVLYLLMCGCGVGFSVERQYVNELPVIADDFYKSETRIVVSDSRIGWAVALRELLSFLYAGRIPTWDLSRLRPSGARLKTFGGRSSGPEPLDYLFNKLVAIFTQAQGRRLNSLECHDIVCNIADVVIVGGVRRSALLSLSNLSDQRMALAKSGSWYTEEGQRALANNSVAYTELPELGIFMREWLNLYESRSGERGIFNRFAAKEKAKQIGRRNFDVEFGTNPCAEITLPPFSFCNLTEAVIRPGDTIKQIGEKVRIAAIIGTFQSTFTDFRYLRNIWRKNAEEERLLGVSLTGIMDHSFLRGDDDNLLDNASLKDHLSQLKKVVIKTNETYAKKLGINPSVATTTIKPSGTVSQLVGSASGIHPRYAPYYLRSVRLDNKDAVCQFMKDKGVPNEPEQLHPDSQTVFYFPFASPEGSKTVKDVTALEQLKLYSVYYQNWAEHNISLSVYLKQDEWLAAADWVYKNFKTINGVSFFPVSNHVYKQAPYKEITKEEYEKLIQEFPKLDFTEMIENEDSTMGSQELACTSGMCEI